MIKTWQQRCEEHQDHENIVTEQMIRERMQEEIDELRQALARPKKEWVGLTDDEINDWFFQRLKQAGSGWALDDVVRAVEAKLKEKNNG